jgi:hypothetical protein
VYCLHCATKLVEPFPESCPKCHKEVDLTTVARLLDYAGHVMIAARHSIPTYSGREPGDRKRTWTPDIAEPAKWVALAIVAGVLGNLATDGLKALVRNLRSSTGSGQTRMSTRDYLDDEPEIMIEQARSFFETWPRLPPHVKASVVEEIGVHVLLRRALIRAHGRLEALPGLTEERLREIVADAFVEALEFLPGEPPEELTSLWGDFVYEEPIEEQVPGTEGA